MAKEKPSFRWAFLFVQIGSANRTARKLPKPALPLTFPFPETMAKWPVMLDEFRFEVVSHGGRTGIQMRILKDEIPLEGGGRLQRRSRGQKRASRATAQRQRR